MTPSGDRLEIGDIEIVRLLDGTFRVDGGAMFGVVPRTLWAQRAVPDGENRITLALNCFLVRTPETTLLLDTGVGPDVDRRYADFYSFERNPGLFGLLAGLGLGPDDIDVVVNSHLHFDHCGGNTLRSGDGKWVPAFPKARYVVQRGEWEQALHPVERDRPSYLPARLKPLGGSGNLSLVEGDGPVAPGVEVILVPGHTAFHQGVKVVAGGRTFFYLGDAVPTAAHIDLPYIMSYDLYPVETFNNKKVILARAADEGWMLAFSHDLSRPLGTLHRSGKRLDLVPAAALAANKD
ncbi:MAG TPA: MBL fold metallo-hydrolase [Candidatus Latescibacteria bacterium]|nr:MBL fold metallo-hydrolase [Candidatus Latescibacterota bacterium]